MKRLGLLLLPIVFCLLLFAQCKKNPFNYRTKYLGDYTFTVHKILWSMSPLGTNIDTNYFYDGKIEYGTIKNTMLIHFSENNTVEVIVSKDGLISNDNDYDPVTGKFESKTSMNFSYHLGGLGSGGSYGVSGTKK